MFTTSVNATGLVVSTVSWTSRSSPSLGELHRGNQPAAESRVLPLDHQGERLVVLPPGAHGRQHPQEQGEGDQSERAEEHHAGGQGDFRMHHGAAPEHRHIHRHYRQRGGAAGLSSEQSGTNTIVSMAGVGSGS